MKILLISILLTIFICFKPIYGASNSTTTTPTTTTYTSTMFYDTLPDLTDDPTNDEIECLFEADVTLSYGEDIELTLCGYEETVGDDAITITMIGITIQVPHDRWVGVGFSTTNNFNEDDQMKNIYTIVIPAYSRDDIHERYMISKVGGDHGEKLASTLTVVSDENSMGNRIVKLTRKLEIGYDDIKDEDTTGIADQYFDFNNLKDCDETAKVIWAFAAKPNDPFIYHGSGAQRGSLDAVVEMVDGKLCEEETGDATRYTPLSYITITICVFIGIVINY